MAAVEERGRRALSALIDLFAFPRGNWEVDYPDYADPRVMRTFGRGSLFEGVIAALFAA